MRCAYLLTYLLLPLLAVAQSSSTVANGGGSATGSAQTTQASQSSGGSQSTGGTTNASGSGNGTAVASPSITVITSIFTTAVLGSNRVLSTITSTQLSTSTIGGQTTGGGNNNSGTQKPTSTSSLPPPTTAPASIDGGGNVNGHAPSPGADSKGGVMGPDDSYIAGALAHHANLVLVAFTGVVAGSALVIM